MRYANIIRKLYAEPLLIEESAWRAFDHALRDVMQRGKIVLPRFPGALANRLHDDNPDLYDEDDPSPANDDAPVERALPSRVARILSFPTLDTAIITINGVIDKHVALFDLQCYGGVDLDDVDAALDYVRRDDAIKNVLLLFVNCPGGSVIGVPETAEKVYQLTLIKNVKAYSDSVCCSAGIYIASQASEFFVSSSTYSGSIGVMSPPIIDFSRMLAQEGINVTTIKSGKYKDTGSMFRPITEDEVAMLQKRCDKIAGMFYAAVKRTRPRMSAESMQGQVFFGDEAVDIGLADVALPDLQSALAQF